MTPMRGRAFVSSAVCRPLTPHRGTRLNVRKSYPGQQVYIVVDRGLDLRVGAAGDVRVIGVAEYIEAGCGGGLHIWKREPWISKVGLSKTRKRRGVRHEIGCKDAAVIDTAIVKSKQQSVSCFRRFKPDRQVGIDGGLVADLAPEMRLPTPRLIRMGITAATAG